MAKNLDGPVENDDDLRNDPLRAPSKSQFGKSTFRIGGDESANESDVNEASAPVANDAVLKAIGDYEVISVLGRGGMGIVYKARHRTLERTVALKMILGDAHANPKRILRFQTEARAVAKLQHPNIVQLFEVGDEAGTPYLCMEHIDGVDLSSLVHERAMDPTQAVEIVLAVAEAMQYAHNNGILHRDLKPSNVLLTSDGIPKITDFGLAKELNKDSEKTKSGAILGTIIYMSPEQASAETELIGPASDQYSLGAMLYHLITGRPPFVADQDLQVLLQIVDYAPVSPRQLQPSVPVDLETIVMKTLNKFQNGRYPSCQDLANDLQRFLNREPITARPVGKVERSWRWARRNPAVAMLTALATMLLLLTTIVSTTYYFSAAALNKKLEKQTVLANEKTILANNQSLLANKHQADAEEKAESAKQQAIIAMKLLQDVSTKVDSTLASKPEMSELRHDVLDQMLEMLGKLDDSVLENEMGQAASTRMHLLDKKGKMYLANSRFREATDIYDELEDVARHQVEIHDATGSSRNNLLSILALQAKLKTRINRDIDQQLEYLEECVELIENMHDDPRPTARFELPMARSHFDYSDRLTEIAVVHMNRGDLEKSRDFFHRAKECREALLEDLDQYSDYLKMSDASRLKLETEIKTNLDKSLLGLAAIAERMGNTQEAESALTAIYESRLSAFESNPENAQVKLIFAQSASTLGKFYLWSDQHDKAQPNLTTAIELFEELRSYDSDKAIYLRGLSEAYNRQAILIDEGTEYQEWLEKCLNAKQKLANRGSAGLDFNMMICLARLGQTEAALEIYEAASNHKRVDSMIRLGNAACLAQCSRHETDENDQEKLLRKAVDLVEAAIKSGYANNYNLTHDPDLRPLQSRPRFQNIVASINQ